MATAFRNVRALEMDKIKNFVVSLVGSAAPVDGVLGTGAGFAGPGSIYTRTNGTVYINGGAGTKASPVWKLITQAA